MPGRTTIGLWTTNTRTSALDDLKRGYRFIVNFIQVLRLKIDQKSGKIEEIYLAYLESSSYGVREVMSF